MNRDWALQWGGRTAAVAHSTVRPAAMVGLWLLFYSSLFSWWLAMATLFAQHAYITAVVVAYAMPSLYAAVVFVSARWRASRNLPQFGVLAVALVAHVAVWLAVGGGVPAQMVGALVGVGLIAAVMTIMQYPLAGVERYADYRPPVFVAGVIFMALFVYMAAMLPNVPAPPSTIKAVLLPLGFAGFWLSAAWLAVKACNGPYVPGLEVRPLMPFRPDYILPGGVMLVKGTVLMGIGIMLASQPHLNMPKWNWWGFVFAFFGIISIIPLRGIFKMSRGRRLRMLGAGGRGWGYALASESLLVLGLGVLLYGFVNAFFGGVPFETLGVRQPFNAFLGGSSVTQVVGVVSLVAGVVLLVPLRALLKMRLREGMESWSERFLLQVLLWLGILALFVAAMQLLNLPPVRVTGVIGFHPGSNPVGFDVGLGLFVLGSLLILGLRPVALRNELEATMVSMAGVIADQPEDRRRWLLERRIRVLAGLPENQRRKHVAWMVSGLGSLTQSQRRSLMETQTEVLATLPADARRAMMRAMDAAASGAGARIVRGG